MSVIDFDVETALNGFGALIFVVWAGVAVGLAVGLTVGFTVGLAVGFAVGLAVGFTVGLTVGFGVLVGVMTGDEVASAASIFFLVYQKLQSTFPVMPLTFPLLVYCQYS